MGIGLSGNFTITIFYAGTQKVNRPHYSARFFFFGGSFFVEKKYK